MRHIHKRHIVAALRQLEMAVQLWFREEDPVSIHTLTSAAREILRALHKKTGKKPAIFAVEPTTKGGRKKLSDMLSATAVFFKHSNTDPNAVHDFAPEYTTVLLLDAVSLLLDLADGNLTPWTVLFLTHLTTVSPRRFSKQYLEFNCEIAPADMLRQRSRAEFFRKFCDGVPKMPPLPSFYCGCSVS